MTPTQAHRAKQLLLRKATISQLERLWPLLDWAALDASYPKFAVAVGALVKRNRATSAGLSVAYLRALRKASGIPGGLLPVVPPFNAEQFGTSLRVASVVTAKNAAGRGEAADVAMGAALAVTSGAMARLVLNAGRDTVTATGKTDPESSGWRWVLGGSTHCPYCLDRAGQVYDDDAEFHSHDTCGCSPEIVYP